MKKYFFMALIVVLFLFGLVSLSVANTGFPRGKSAAADILPDELKSVKIEDYFIESKGLPAGWIQNATGHVVVVHKDTSRAYFAATGDTVYQEDVFYTLKDSRCRIMFSTEDIITMGENSKVVADEIVDDRISKEKKSSISMLKGKAMFYVVRLFRYKNISANVKTPTAVVGVRGTKFGIEVRKTGEKVADVSDDSFIYLAQNEPGNIETVVYGFEGTVDVTSTVDGIMQTLGAGENLVLDNAGAGDVEPTDPNTANQFVRETESGGSDGGGGSGSSGEVGTDKSGGDTGAGVEEGGETGETGNTTDTDSEDVAQTLSAQSIGIPGTRVGYFSAILTRFDGANTYLADVYANYSRVDISSSSVSGKSIVDPAGSMTAVGTGSDELTSYLTRINTVAGGPYDSGDLGTTCEMDNDVNTPGWPADETLGQNSYMKWGFWRMSRWVPGDSTPAFAITDRAYYVEGLPTSDAAVVGMSGAYTYEGPAWGTYFDGDGGKDMTGSFKCGINMTDKTVTDFDMSVSGGGRAASIGNASGSFFGSSGEFKITGGDWFLTNSSPLNIVTGGVIQSGANALCTGSLFGPNAEHMGGVWAMDKGSGDNAAVGIFVGDKGGSPTIPAAPPDIPSPPSPPPDEPTPITPTGPTDKMGYFTAMLTRYDGYEYVNNGMFVSHTLEDLNGLDKVASDIIYGYTMSVDGLAGNDGKLSSVDYHDGGGGGITDGPYPVTRTVLDQNLYMEWGYWTQMNPMVDTEGNTNWVHNRGYYTAGDNTADISALNQTWTYSGGAEGTYWTAAGGANMTGSFNATVNFSTPEITDFYLSVSGEGHSVSIANATGPLSGSDFVLSGGTWQIDSLAATLTAGYGSVYGPEAEAIGGVWGVKEHEGEIPQYATGIFHGDKHNEPISPEVPSPPPITPTGPTEKMGYFTAMLTHCNGYEDVNNGVFVSHYMQDIENGTDLIADDIVNGHEMHIDGSEEKLTSVVYSSESGGGGITGPYPVSRTELNHNDYMEWGYWAQTTATYTAMPDNDEYDNWINNRGYYIAGDNTPDISALNQVWTYSGGAEGTYWTANDGLPGGGINMTGSFNATVNFGLTSGQITDFDLTVSGGGNNVTMSNATGSFDGGGSSQFTLDVGHGTATTINSAPVKLGEGYGSVYGPSAEAMGGVWGVKEDEGAVPQYATGIFHGTR